MMAFFLVALGTMTTRARIYQEGVVMWTIFRRLLLLWLFMFWQGGFLFYSAVVVSIGSDVQGSDFAQGLITRRVSTALNLTGLAVLLVWTLDLVAERDTRLKRRWTVWFFLIVTLGVLVWLHPRMDALIDLEQERLRDDGLFRHLHRWYLRVSTAQWIASVVFTLWTLQNWRAADRNSHSW
jgi:hypothetical protein